MAEEAYVIIQGLPTPQEYHDLRKAANLTPPPLEYCAKALANSFACFVAYERNNMLDEKTPGPEQSPVAMGRLLGDGALFLQVTDVAVHPDHQGKGLGKRILKMVTDYVDEHAPQAYVSLMGEPMGQGLYSKYGFEDVKPSIGMFRCAWIQNNPEFKRLREEKAAKMVRDAS
jgi:ribosomal protein S18 acetylase RimI-like enzyme